MLAGISESRTLWIGEIESWMDESYVASLFNQIGQILSVKVIRDRNTGLPAGYGFVEFSNHDIAQQVLQKYNGVQMPGTQKAFRLNWGMFGGGVKPSMSVPVSSTPQSQIQQQVPQTQTQKVIPTATTIVAGQDYSIYVGDLDPGIKDLDLLQFFQQRYMSVIGAKVIVDPITKYSKGYGFVKFNNFTDSQRAISECNGLLLRSRHIKCNQSSYKNVPQADANYMQAMTAITSTTTPTTTATTIPTDYNSQILSYYQSVLQNPVGYYDQYSQYQYSQPVAQQQQTPDSSQYYQQFQQQQSQQYQQTAQSGVSSNQNQPEIIESGPKINVPKMDKVQQKLPVVTLIGYKEINQEYINSNFDIQKLNEEIKLLY